MTRRPIIPWPYNLLAAGALALLLVGGAYVAVNVAAIAHLDDAGGR